MARESEVHGLSGAMNYDTDFLKLCLGAGAKRLSISGESADEFLSIPDSDDAQFWEVTENFAMNGDSDEDEDGYDEDNSDLELDDVFNFDPERVASLLKAGASMEELSEAMQDSMASQLYHRLDRDVPGSGTIEENCEQEEVYDLDGQMTPPSALSPRPLVSVKQNEADNSHYAVGQRVRVRQQAEEDWRDGTVSSVDPLEVHADVHIVSQKWDFVEQATEAEIEARIEKVADAQSSKQATRLCFLSQEAIKSAWKNRRSSSAVQQEAIQSAIAKAEQRCRKSMAIRMSQAPMSEAKVTRKSLAAAANRRARMSICKAAEVLEVAGVEEQPQADVDAQMRLIHKAMADARARHRKSIATAVQHLAGNPYSVNGPSSSAPSQESSAVQQKIQQAIAAAAERRNQGGSAGGGVDAAAITRAQAQARENQLVPTQSMAQAQAQARENQLAPTQSIARAQAQARENQLAAAQPLPTTPTQFWQSEPHTTSHDSSAQYWQHAESWSQDQWANGGSAQVECHSQQQYVAAPADSYEQGQAEIYGQDQWANGGSAHVECHSQQQYVAAPADSYAHGQQGYVQTQWVGEGATWNSDITDPTWGKHDQGGAQWSSCDGVPQYLGNVPSPSRSAQPHW